jgi:hypothetical protein
MGSTSYLLSQQGCRIGFVYDAKYASAMILAKRFYTLTLNMGLSIQVVLVLIGV